MSFIDRIHDDLAAAAAEALQRLGDRRLARVLVHAPTRTFEGDPPVIKRRRETMSLAPIWRAAETFGVPCTLRPAAPGPWSGAPPHLR